MKTELVNGLLKRQQICWQASAWPVFILAGTLPDLPTLGGGPLLYFAVHPKTHPSSVDASFPSAKFNLLPVSFCWFEPRPVPVVPCPLPSATSPPLRFPLHCHVRSNRSSVRRPAGRGKCLSAYYLTAQGLTGSIERDGGREGCGAIGVSREERGSCHCLAVAI